MYNYDTEERIKRLEEEVMYLRRDVNILRAVNIKMCDVIEVLQKPEFHTHYTKVIENITCTGCDN